MPWRRNLSAPGPPLWQGPGATYFQANDTPPSCEDAPGYDDEQVFLRDIVGAPSNCECTCAATDPGCSFKADFYTPGDCSGNSMEFNIEPGCNMAVGVGASGQVQLSANGVGGAPPCEPTLDIDVPAPTASTVVMCTGQLVGAKACGPRSVCLPNISEPFNQGACIWRDGAGHACPNDFPEGSAAGVTVSDTRSCTECKCGAADGCALGTIQLFDNNGCNGAPNESYAGAGCHTLSGSNLVFGANYVPATCDAEQSIPTGEVTSSGNVTVCCLK